MTRIEDQYGRFPHVPYHNNVHAADVVHSVHNMLNAPQLANTFTPLELFATIISAACHDVDHPGMTNTFMQATWSPLAVLYNNKVWAHQYHEQVHTRTCTPTSTLLPLTRLFVFMWCSVCAGEPPRCRHLSNTDGRGCEHSGGL